MSQRIDFLTHPDLYQHWMIEISAPVARLILNVKESGGLFEGYELKLNSYDLGVDIELADAIQRLRFEHPEVKTVVICSGKDNAFCAGANIRMLAGATHVHKVNFCKFTNETRNAIEDATEFSQQSYMTAINATAAGGGYELALATDKIVIVDDGNASVSLPEVPLLAVLPGTGGLTRLVDKRKVRRDIADVFCTLEEGMRGDRALQARLVDESVPKSMFDDRCEALALDMAAQSDRPDTQTSVRLGALHKTIDSVQIKYSHVTVELNRERQFAVIEVFGPKVQAPLDGEAIEEMGDQFWPLLVIRELDDALLELRFNEPELGSIFFKSNGTIAQVCSFDDLLTQFESHWFVREVNLYIRRVLKRLDLTSRSLFALIEPGSCFAGFIAEIAFAADRSFMLEGQFEDDDDRAEATLHLTPGNFGRYATVNGLTRLEIRFLGDLPALENAQTMQGKSLLAPAAAEAGLVTSALDDIDWEDEIRLLEEERAGFSPDALTGMEANLRFPGPETMESKIFSRLTAWQNWIFQRPNSVGPNGSLRLYGTGRRPRFDKQRV